MPSKPGNCIGQHKIVTDDLLALCTLNGMLICTLKNFVSSVLLSLGLFKLKVDQYVHSANFSTWCHQSLRCSEVFFSFSIVQKRAIFKIISRKFKNTKICTPGKKYLKDFHDVRLLWSLISE